MASKVRDYNKLADDILEAVGGEDNIENATRCATRLRLVLKNTDPKAKEKVSSLPGVITVVENSGQFQVVIGQHVGEVYEAFISNVNVDASDQESDNKGTILNRVIATMSAVFAPFVYILAAAGILQGILILIKLAFPAFEQTGTFEVLNFMSWAPFTFLPIFIAITASKHFKVNTYIAVAATAALVTPDWTAIAERIADGETFTFLGIALSETTYTSSVLPPLFLVWILSYVEKFLNKKIHEVVRPLFVPFFSILIMVPLVLLLIGPITTWGANGIANGYNYLAEVFPALAGAIIGGFWQVLVIFGVHWGVTPMVLANFEQYGMDSFQAYQTIAVIAQVGAVFGVLIKAKNSETRKVSASAGITGIFGITEPAIYGVTLRFKKPFIYGCISGAIGAITASFFSPFYFAYAGLPSAITTVNAINMTDYPSSIWGVLIGSAIAIVLPIILVQIFGYGEDTAKQGSKELAAEQGETGTEEAAQATETAVVNEEEIKSPLTGKVVPLADVADEVFSSGAMGKGIAIDPTENILYAPADSTVVMIAQTKHAIGLRTDTGLELLIHVGLDTVGLKGEPFDVKVTDGQAVKQGDVLLEFNRELIIEHGLQTVTPIIVTDMAGFEEVAFEEISDSKAGEKLFTMVK
ncbi:beta-glucoside-specific PTS transporter subunit IIABC [Gracilibacillus alcaliphilus]|uniref:beta-glucoside-specific PTS transporter subunit IIABC n=1 Tax=Gracilibacillus alcaliphilus TaxID=1401441 RepID=UPI001957528D|nr:beta-glucoside-specific PTS transporter subunit IIABC [Gracilibacillus alcaliphilus]MBM7676251.1 PTS system beta-glucosides-specific IIC component [Gracilibacillus alcaliphilus]